MDRSNGPAGKCRGGLAGASLAMLRSVLATPAASKSRAVSRTVSVSLEFVDDYAPFPARGKDFSFNSQVRRIVITSHQRARSGNGFGTCINLHQRLVITVPLDAELVEDMRFAMRYDWAI